mmetsp:Transcript_9660/g.18902  ORF Transcript_9660/g.18902 Transcript_9660/m.18902 type:complete len:211 (+) Transcript_9660:62-694(+)
MKPNYFSNTAISAQPKPRPYNFSVDLDEGLAEEPPLIQTTLIKSIIRRSPSPALDSGQKQSPVKVVDMSAYIFKGETLTAKPPSRAKRESAAMIAHRKWQTSKTIKRTRLETSLELSAQNFFQSHQRAQSTFKPAPVSTEPPVSQKTSHFSLTMTPKNRVSRVEADELVRHLLLNKHTRHRSILQSLEHKGPPKRKIVLSSGLHKSIGTE